MCAISTVIPSNGSKASQMGTKIHRHALEGTRFLKKSTIILPQIDAMSVPRGMISAYENLEKIILRLLCE